MTMLLWNRSRRIAVRSKQSKERRVQAEADWLAAHPPPLPGCAEGCDYVSRGLVLQCRICKNFKPWKPVVESGS